MKYLPPQDMLPCLTECITILRSLREHSTSAAIDLIRCMSLLEMLKPIPKLSRTSLLKLSIPPGTTMIREINVELYKISRMLVELTYNITTLEHGLLTLTKRLDLSGLKYRSISSLSVILDDLGSWAKSMRSLITEKTDASKSMRTRPAVVLMMPGQCPSTCLTKLRATSSQASLSFHPKKEEISIAVWCMDCKSHFLVTWKLGELLRSELLEVMKTSTDG